MTIESIKKEYIYNTDYIIRHKLSEKKIREANIELLGYDEIFVQYPKWKDYYCSSYGRVISLKNNSVRLLNPTVDTNGYDTYKFTKTVRGKGQYLPITGQRVVADIFLPNYWQRLTRNQLQAHHMDHNKLNNYWKNLLLIPANLHNIMNRVKKVALFRNRTFRNMNLYEIHEVTNYDINDIVMITKKKPIKTIEGKYTVFQLGEFLIGYQFYPEKNKKK